MEELNIIIHYSVRDLLMHCKGTFSVSQQQYHIFIAHLFHCTLGVTCIYAIYVSNNQSHGNFGILFAGHGRYPAVLNTQ